MKEYFRKKYDLPTLETDTIIINQIKTNKIDKEDIYVLYSGIAEYVTINYRSSTSLLDEKDKLQEAKYGLWLGVLNFDPYKSTQIKSYLIQYSRGTLLSAIRDKGYYFRFKNKKAMEFIPNISYIEEEDENEFEYSEKESVFINFSELKEKLIQISEKRSVHKTIIEERFLAHKALSYQKIADRHSLCKKRIVQIEKNIIRDLKNLLTSEYEEFSNA